MALFGMYQSIVWPNTVPGDKIQREEVTPWALLQTNRLSLSFLSAPIRYWHWESAPL